MKKRDNVFKSFKYLGRALLYVGFLLVGYNTLTNENSNKPMVIGIIIVVLAFNIFYDYLKYLLNDIMKSIIFSENSDEIIKKIDHLEKVDIFKGLKSSLIIPKLLLSMDMNDPNSTLEILNKEQKFFTSKPDYLLISKYSKFKANTLMDNKRHYTKSYEDLLKLRESNFKSSKMNLLFNWFQIDGLYKLQLKNYSQSAQLYDKVETKNLNPREQVHYYYELAQNYKGMKNYKKYKEITTIIESISPHSPFTQLLKEHSIEKF